MPISQLKVPSQCPAHRPLSLWEKILCFLGILDRKLTRCTKYRGHDREIDRRRNPDHTYHEDYTGSRWPYWR